MERTLVEMREERLLKVDFPIVSSRSYLKSSVLLVYLWPCLRIVMVAT